MAPQFRGTFTTQWYNPVMNKGKGKWMTAVERGEWTYARDSINGMRDKHMRCRLLVHIPLQLPGEEQPRIHILTVKEWDKAGTMVYANVSLISDMAERGMDVGMEERYVGVVKQRHYQGRPRIGE